MIQDLHSHTYYSFCGRGKPEETVEAAIRGGIQLFGITDHAHGVGHGTYDIYKADDDNKFADYGETLLRYYDHMNLIRQKYADKITVLLGIELHTGIRAPRATIPDGVDVSFFDYCLVENLDWEGSVTEGDIFTFAKRCNTPAVGIAHTDLFTFLYQTGRDPGEFFKRMAEENIFWEMNVSYDSPHHYFEHPYVQEFFRTPRQQEIVRESGVKLSVGFDGHRPGEYKADRVAHYCRLVEKLGIPMIFEELVK